MTFYFEWVDSDFMLSKVLMKMILNSILVYIFMFVFNQIKGKSKISLDHPHNLLVIVTVSSSAFFHVHQDQHHRSVDFFFHYGASHPFDNFFDLLLDHVGQHRRKKRGEKTKILLFDPDHVLRGRFGLLRGPKSPFFLLDFFRLRGGSQISPLHYLWSFLAAHRRLDGSFRCDDFELHEHLASSKNRISQQQKANS